MTGKSKNHRSNEGRVVLPPSGLAEEIIGRKPEEPPPGQLYAFADSLAGQAEAVGGEMNEEFLETWTTFTLDRESFGLPVTHVQEILRVTTITRVPHAPHPVRGVTNLRGRVLPVVDLRLRLGLQPASVTERSRILVVCSCGRQMGLLVDAVQQVVRLDRKKVQPPPPDVMTQQSDYIMGVYHLQEALVILLEVEKVLTIHDSTRDGQAEA